MGPQQVDHFALHDDAGAARLHPAGDAFVDLHIKARSAQGHPCAEASMEPPATAILSGRSAPDMAGRPLQLGLLQVRAGGAGEEGDATDEHSRNARHTQDFAHAALRSAV
jgi:hypothetical protein